MGEEGFARSGTALAFPANSVTPDVAADSLVFSWAFLDCCPCFWELPDVTYSRAFFWARENARQSAWVWPDRVQNAQVEDEEDETERAAAERAAAERASATDVDEGWFTGGPGDRAFSGACEERTQGPYPLAVDWYWCGFRLGWMGLPIQYSDL